MSDDLTSTHPIDDLCNADPIEEVQGATGSTLPESKGVGSTDTLAVPAWLNIDAVASAEMLAQIPVLAAATKALLEQVEIYGATHLRTYMRLRDLMYAADTSGLDGFAELLCRVVGLDVVDEYLARMESELEVLDHYEPESPSGD
jgi:hypothetical protein